LDDVEVESISGNITVDKPNSRSMISERTLKDLDKIFDNHRDRKLVELIVDGVRSTADFIDILGLHSLSIKEQRREVKRHKDRIILRLKRYGKSIDEKDR
jgi:RNA polymerase sigma-70 factor (ECF subfamily)